MGDLFESLVVDEPGFADSHRCAKAISGPFDVVDMESREAF